jgi:hypothetical protein
MKSIYFAYGANMHPAAMKYRCPAAVPVCQFDLLDWKLEFYNHATIVPRAGCYVPGVLWEITEDCEYALDAYEGYPAYYVKRDWYQGDRDFFFYEMTPNNRTGSPGSSYVANIADSYRHWNIPSDVLKAVTYENYAGQAA